MNRNSKRPSMVWKTSTDLQTVLVPREGSVDSIQGYVVYNLIQKTAEDPNVLSDEIEDLRKVFKGRYNTYKSTDPEWLSGQRGLLKPK